MKKTLLFAAALFAANFAMAQNLQHTNYTGDDNNLVVQQVGDDNLADITGYGDMNQATIKQDGLRNTGRIDQGSASEIQQESKAVIDQAGGNDNYGWIQQKETGGTEGLQNDATIYQRGTNNRGIIWQDNDKSDASIMQTGGNNNDASIWQTAGDGNHAEITQTGSENDARTEQHGKENWAEVTTIGDHNTVNTTQNSTAGALTPGEWKNGSETIINGSGNTEVVTQTNPY